MYFQNTVFVFKCFHAVFFILNVDVFVPISDYTTAYIASEAGVA